MLDYNTITKWLNKFWSDYKNLDNQARSFSPKSVDSEAVLQDTEMNPVSYTQIASGELGISTFNQSQISWSQ